MSDNPKGESKGTGLAIGGLGLAMVLCCGLPLLIVGGALGGMGALLGNPWLIGAAVALLAGVVVWRQRRANDRSAGSCCPPEPPAHDQSRQSHPSPSRHPER
jgi:predicted lipid-binding transport protein (Tim44 family)